MHLATAADTRTAVAVYPDHAETEAAVKALQRGGFEMRRRSIVGADYDSEEDVVGYYKTGDRMSSWGNNGAFGGGSGAYFSEPLSSSYRVSARSSRRDPSWPQALALAKAPRSLERSVLSEPASSV